MSDSMSAGQFTAKMDKVAHAIQVASLMLHDVTDDDLDAMSALISRSETMGPFLTTTLEFPAAMQRLDNQREAIKVARTVRGFYRAMQEAHDGSVPG